MKDIRYTTWMLEDKHFNKFFILNDYTQFQIKRPIININDINVDYYLNFKFMDKANIYTFKFSKSPTIMKNLFYLIRILSSTVNGYLYNVEYHFIDNILKNINKKATKQYVKILDPNIHYQDYANIIVNKFTKNEILKEHEIESYLNIWKDFGFICAFADNQKDLETTNNIKWYSLYDLLLNTTYLNYFMKYNKGLTYLNE